MIKSSADVEAEVEASRNNLDRNVEALKQKMTPGQLFDEAARMLGASGQQVGAKFVEQAKANPMPLAVVGLGLAWLMVSNGKSHAAAEPRSFAAADYGDYGDEGGAGDGLKEKTQQTAQSLSDKAHGLGDALKDKVAGARASAVDTARSAAQSLNGAAAEARDKAGLAAQQVQRTFAQTLESEPLLLAGLGLIVGVAVGAAFPSTEAENRLMGEHRDHLVDKGKDLAQSGLEKAADAAEATYGAVKGELKNGDTDRQPAERLADAARTGVQVAQAHLQGPTH